MSCALPVSRCTRSRREETRRGDQRLVHSTGHVDYINWEGAVWEALVAAQGWRGYGVSEWWAIVVCITCFFWILFLSISHFPYNCYYCYYCHQDYYILLLIIKLFSSQSRSFIFFFLDSPPHLTREEVCVKGGWGVSKEICGTQFPAGVILWQLCCANSLIWRHQQELCKSPPVFRVMQQHLKMVYIL